jgi:hypothetical protein
MSEALNLALARSFLFVPATRPERYAKALASGADAVIIDLEDAVAPADKMAARQMLAQAWPGLPAAQRGCVLVRLNASGTAWHGDDLALLGTLGVVGVVLPKAESAADLARVAAAMGPACALLPLIESVAGLDAADALARSLWQPGLPGRCRHGLRTRRARADGRSPGPGAGLAPRRAGCAGGWCDGGNAGRGTTAMRCPA